MTLIVVAVGLSGVSMAGWAVNHLDLAPPHAGMSPFIDMFAFYPRDAMLARVIAIATCPSVCLSVCPSRAGIVSKRRKLAA